MMSRMHLVRLSWMAVSLCTATAAGAQTGGLKVDTDATTLTAPRLQTRMALGNSSITWSGQAGLLLGDYYLHRSVLGDNEVSGGFRATSGVLLGQRAVVLGTPSLRLTPGTDAWSATPYVGVGWSGAWLRKGWGFSADVGFAARNASNTGLRVGNVQSLDDVLREMRLTPLLQMGVSYAF